MLNVLNVLNVRKQLVCQTAQLSLQTCIWAAWLLFFTAQNQCGRWTGTGPEKFRVETASTPVIWCGWGWQSYPFNALQNAPKICSRKFGETGKMCAPEKKKTLFSNYGEWVGGTQEKEL